MSTELESRRTAQIAVDPEMSIEQLLEQNRLIIEAQEKAMRPNEHYGVIPGTNKPTLLKPGAEKLCVLFRLAPHYERDIIWHPDDHMTAVVTCTLRHILSGNVVAQGEGLCTTKESKYAYRTARRRCPRCGAEAIIKGKAEYGGGWICWKKAQQPGCGANFAENEPAITQQETGKVANPDIADTYNTVLKMADKRALVAAVLNGTAASDAFTQDVEDQRSEAREETGSGQPEPHAAGGGANGAAADSPPAASPSWDVIQTWVRGSGERKNRVLIKARDLAKQDESFETPAVFADIGRQPGLCDALAGALGLEVAA